MTSTNARYGTLPIPETAAAYASWEKRWQTEFAHRWVKVGSGYFPKDPALVVVTEPKPDCRATIRALEAQINQRRA